MGKDFDDEVVTTLKSYIYLDEFEINALYNQLFPNILEETLICETQNSGGLEGNVGGSILDAVSADGALNYSHSKNTTKEIKTTVSIEHKANVLIQHICNNRLKSLEEVIDIAKNNKSLLRGRIVVGYATFGLTYIYDSQDRLIDLMKIPYNFNKKDTTFILESGRRNNLKELSVNEDGSYYEAYSASAGKYGLEMHMSGNKIRRETRHLTRVIKKGKSFDFTVLGQLSYAGDIHYSIKPFAVW